MQSQWTPPTFSSSNKPSSEPWSREELNTNTMKESTICNLLVAEIGENYYINLKGPKGQHICLQIDQRQAQKVVTELELTMKKYDSDSLIKDTRAEKMEKAKDIADIRWLYYLRTDSTVK